jgi:type I restriction enzyme S subunit
MKEFIIPSGWELHKQSEVATFYNGRAYKLTEWEDEGTPVIRLQNLTGTGDKYYYSNLELPEHQYVNNGDLLFMWSATFGPKIWHGDKAIYHYHIWKVECKADLLDQQFMLYNLDFVTESMKSKTNGSTMLHFTKKGMEEQLILTPPLAEQQRIAIILSTVDKKIDLVEQKIKQTKKLKVGLMQKLFSEGVGIKDEDGNWQPHTKFNKGLPASWTTQCLGELARVTSGGTPSRRQNSYWENGHIPWVTTSEVDFNIITKTDQMITQDGLEKSAAKLFPKNTVLMAMYGQGKTRGRVSLLGIESATNQACGAIICGENLIPKFCYQYLAFNYEKNRKIGNEGSQKNLNGRLIKELIIHCPNIDEQMEIAKIAFLVDEKLTLLKEQKVETKKLKKGLMQKLLTGEWRVSMDDNEAA